MFLDFILSLACNEAALFIYVAKFSHILINCNAGSTLRFKTFDYFFQLLCSKV